MPLESVAVRSGLLRFGTMPDPTGAARQRRYRARQRGLPDPDAPQPCPECGRQVRSTRTAPRRGRVAADAVMHMIAEMHAEGVATLRANSLAERLCPDGRHHNANGQVFHLGAAVAARLLRQCPAVREKETRLWEILPYRLLPLEGAAVAGPINSSHPEKPDS